MDFRTAARVGVDQDVGVGEGGLDALLGLDHDGVGRLQRQLRIQIDVHLHHQHLPGHAGAELVQARDTGIGQDGGGDGDAVLFGSCMIQQMVCRFAQQRDGSPEQPDRHDQTGRRVSPGAPR